MEAFRASHTVMLYMASPQEVQTAALIAEARRQGKRVAVPVVTRQGLLAVECPLSAADVRRGPYGILEPRDMSAVVPPADIDWVLAPGVGFDVHGMRLGYGAGYYDRFLPQLSATARYGGIAFHIQIVPCLPRMPHDVDMQFVVTEQGVQSYAPSHLTTPPPCIGAK